MDNFTEALTKDLDQLRFKAKLGEDDIEKLICLVNCNAYFDWDKVIHCLLMITTSPVQWRQISTRPGLN